MEVRDQYQTYRAITFAQQAAAADVIAHHLTTTRIDDTTKAAIERTHREAYYSIAFAWHALQSDIDIDIERCAIDADLAETAAFSALQAAIDTALDADPEIVKKCQTGHDILMRTDKTLRTLHNAYYDSHIDDESDTDDTPPAAPMPDKPALMALYEAIVMDFPRVFEVPDSLLAEAQEAAQDTTLTPADIAFKLACKAAPDKGAPGECRYCGAPFKGTPHAISESVNKGVCWQCDKMFVLSMLHDIYNVIGYNPITGEAILGNIPDIAARPHEYDDTNKDEGGKPN